MTASPVPPTPHREPLEHIVWLAATEVHPNAWNPNRVAAPERDLLARSLLLTGWVQPLLVAPRPAEAGGGYLLIDGFHRWGLSQHHPEVRARWGGLVPAAVLDLDVPSAMLLTVRINRAKGTHASVLMARLVAGLLDLGVTRERVAQEMGATLAEVDLLATPNVFKTRDLGDRYAQAWHPAESGKGPGGADRPARTPRTRLGGAGGTGRTGRAG